MVSGRFVPRTSNPPGHRVVLQQRFRSCFVGRLMMEMLDRLEQMGSRGYVMNFCEYIRTFVVYGYTTIYPFEWENAITIYYPF